jgi:hypothetical protein
MVQVYFENQKNSSSENRKCYSSKKFVGRPARLPDLNPCDCFSWGYFKDKAYSALNIILNATMNVRRTLLYVESNARQFEYFRTFNSNVIT